MNLDGLRIFRFAHAFDGGGGVEQHLSDLNRVLSLRNRLSTVMMRLTPASNPSAQREECIGDSVVIHVPLPATPPAAPSTGPRRRRPSERLQQRVLDVVLPTWRANQLCMLAVNRMRRVPRRPGELENAAAEADRLFSRNSFDLAVLHSTGGGDASSVIAVARRHQVPVIVVHHFANSRLGGLSVRQQVALADCVGGASAVDIPRYLRKHFVNLSDTVDLEFFQPDMSSQENAGASRRPMLYSPARVTPAKGQLDVIRVAGMLHRQGVPVDVLFAGRIDSPAYAQELEAAASTEGISAHVRFAGQVTMRQYRDYYNGADLMLLLTRHHEGMPRTLIDSQAMRVPPIVYDMGGTREGVRNGRTGFLVEPGDLSSVARQAARLLASPDARRAMGEAGRAFVETHFSLQSFAERHERLYRDVLSRRRG